MLRFTLIAATLLLARPALAADFAPMEPQSVRIGERDAVVYYTDTSAGFAVVVTFAANSPDDGTSMRSVATLARGQHMELSLGGPTGQAPAILTIRREEDTLIVVSPAMRTAAAN